MRIVLLGDSHLARIRRELPRLGPDVLNAAAGGATVLDLDAQADRAGLSCDDVAVVSVGTNDSAPWNGVSVDDFHRLLGDLVTARPARRWVLMAPPGVQEARLGPDDRQNAMLMRYGTVAAAVAQSVSGRLVDSRAVLGPLGPRAFDRDGLHLSGEGYRVLLPVLAQAVSS